MDLMSFVSVCRSHNRSRRTAALALFVSAILLVSGCASTADQGAAEEPESAKAESTAERSEPADSDGGAENSDATENSNATENSDAAAQGAVLPVRDGPARETTGDVPHIQIDAVLDPEVGAELQRRAFSLPGLEDRESTVSLPGARSLWLASDVELARPEIILSGREFGHIHPDGSLHLLLPLDRASEVAETKWGEFHPWATRDGFWGGLVMVFTPESLDDVDVSMQLIVDAYNFATGSDLDPADFA